ncbi:hypothetical protein GIB67_032196 [Kingdonia uniflora]|uniref:Uncharacterized protein n=1 Tax=Kingdonia uniflora TaxID=39325 RepID=A0A7J7MWX7_9MAGN|nr:hypothetical protein GIB67_032196 [Kingdonia uniflora]
MGLMVGRRYSSHGLKSISSEYTGVFELLVNDDGVALKGNGACGDRSDQGCGSRVVVLPMFIEVCCLRRPALFTGLLKVLEVDIAIDLREHFFESFWVCVTVFAKFGGTDVGGYFDSQNFGADRAIEAALGDVGEIDEFEGCEVVLVAIWAATPSMELPAWAELKRRVGAIEDNQLRWKAKGGEKGREIGRVGSTDGANCRDLTMFGGEVGSHNVESIFNQRDASNWSRCSGLPTTVAIKANHYDGLSGELAVCPVILRPCVNMVEECLLRRTVKWASAICRRLRVGYYSICGASRWTSEFLARKKSRKEAYEEFKHVLLALIYGKDDQTSPVANEWAVIRRFKIAGLLSYALRAYLSAYDPIFSMTLRYLISIHKGFFLLQGIYLPISDLTERLLLEERDPPLVPQESLFEAPPFDENVELLDELVHEYCLYRGPVESGITSSFSGILSGQQILAGSSTNHEQGLGYVSSKVSNSDFIDDSSEERNAEAMVIDSTELGFQRSRSHGIGERSRRKRWRGRVEKVEDIPDVSFAETETKTNNHDFPASSLVADSNILEEQQIALKHSGVEIITSKEDDKYEFVLEIKELTCKGMASEVVEEVDATDPSFFVLNPYLLLQLKQLVKYGDHSGSLRIACSYLGPLAASSPTLLKPLKVTLLVLLKPNEDVLDKGIPFSVLPSSLQVILGRRLGVDEPLLIKLMRAILHTHNEWFRLQMCKDRFGGLWKIDTLKEIKTPLIIDGVSKKNTDNFTP